MRTSRRRFLEISSTVSALLPVGRLLTERSSDTFLEHTVGAAQENQKRRSTRLPTSPFKDLEGWASRGNGRWTVENGEIVANGEGWLVLKEGLEDFAIRFEWNAALLVRDDWRTRPRTERDWQEFVYLTGLYATSCHDGNYSLVPVPARCKKPLASIYIRITRSENSCTLHALA